MSVTRFSRADRFSRYRAERDVLQMCTGTAPRDLGHKHRIEIPIEILRMILAPFSKRSLKKARLASKALSAAAIPFLFDTVNVAPNFVDMQKAIMMSARFGSSIRIMNFAGIFYKHLSFPNLFGTSDEAPPRNGHSGALLTDDVQYWRKRDLRRLCGVYCELADRHENYLNDGLFSADLTQLIQNLPILRNIYVDGRSPKGRHKDCLCRTAVWEATRHMPIANSPELLGLVNPHQWKDCVQYTFTLESGSGNPWQQLLVALAACNSQIKEIVIKGILNMSAMSVDVHSRQSISSTLSGLTKFILQNFRFSEDLPIGSSALSEMTNLRTLELSGRSGMDEGTEHLGLSRNIFDALFEECTFSKLETLKLGSIEGTETQVLRFMRGSPGLRYVSFVYFYLQSGRWVGVFDNICKFKWMETLLIDYPHGAEGTCGKPGEEWDPVEHYHNGKFHYYTNRIFNTRIDPNPFIDEAYWPCYI